MLNVYTTYEFRSNFLCNWQELGPILLTDVFSYIFINRSIDIFLEFWRFCQSSEHLFPPCLHAELPTTCYNHSIVNVQVSIFVTCLNFASTGSRLYVVFVMTWYLAFTTSGRTAKAVRPVISGKPRLSWLTRSRAVSRGVLFRLGPIVPLWKRGTCQPYHLRCTRTGQTVFTIFCFQKMFKITKLIPKCFILFVEHY